MAKQRKNRRRSSLSHKGLFGYSKVREKSGSVQRSKDLNDFFQLQKDLEDSRMRNERLQILAEAVPQIAWIADTDGFQDYFNRRWFEYTGFTEKQTYQGKTALHPDDFPVYVRRWSAALRKGKSYEAEYRFRRKDGMYRWHLVRGLPVRGPSGNIVKWFGTFTDIHDQKEAMEATRRLNLELEQRVSERTAALRKINKELRKEIADRKHAEQQEHAHFQRLKEMIDSLPLGAIVLDEKSRVILVNQRLSELFGFGVSMEKFTGTNWRELMIAIKHKTTHPKEYLKQVTSFLKSRQMHLKQEIELKDGRIFARDYIPIFVGKTYRGAVILYEDITKEKRVDATKSEFMSLASHQLRTPLTAIRWALGRLIRQLDERSDIRPLVESARLASANMSETINTMLFISRVEAGSMQLDVRSIDMCALIHEVANRFRDTAKQKNVTLTIQCESVAVRSDQKILSEILQNLLSNAVKYTPAGGKVTLSAYSSKKGVVLTVKDSGVGIPQYQQEKVFSKFFRADNVIQHVTDGTGLGLYLVSLLVSTLGALITFTSKEGKGSTFRIQLPLVTPQVNRPS